MMTHPHVGVYTKAVHMLAIAAALTSCQPRKIKDKASTLQSDSSNSQDSAVFANQYNFLEIHLHGETWRRMTTHRDQGGYACEDEAPYGHVKTFKFRDVRSGEITTLHNIGMRVKGNTSCDEPVAEKGFRLHFGPVDKKIKATDGSTFETISKVYEEWNLPLKYDSSLEKTIKDQTLFGLSAIALRRGANDRTHIRDSIASHIFAAGGKLRREKRLADAPSFGGDVFRSTVAWVRIHDGISTLMEGPYGIAEIVNDYAMDSRYGKDSTKHLFKIKEAKGTFLPSDMPDDADRLLAWYEPELVDGKDLDSKKEAAVKFKMCETGKLDRSECNKITKKTNRAKEVILGFRSMLEGALGESDFNSRKEKLQSFLDVESIIHYMIAANMTGHWDSLVGPMSNNDYLLFNQKTNKWSVVAWDLDNTAGTGNQNYVWMAGATDFGVDLKYRPLFKAILDHFKPEYENHLKSMLTSEFTFESINHLITVTRDLVAPNNTEEKYELIYRFYLHRWANLWCHAFDRPGSKAKINKGWPETAETGSGHKIAQCSR